MLKKLCNFKKINFLLFSNEEYEVEAHEEWGDDLDAPLDDGEIDNYYRKFVNFMQAQLHRKYDLRSFRKGSRVQNQNEESSSSSPLKLVEKKMKPLDQTLPKKKESLISILHKPKVSKVE